MIQYKCPSCNGEIVFDSDTQKMVCPYCDTEFDVETLKEYDEELRKPSDDSMEWEKFEGNAWSGAESENVVSYTCSSCGGEIIGDKTTAATSCPYCGNPVVLQGQFKGKLRPDWVIPFKLNKDAAKAALTSHLQGKRLLPKLFKDKNRIEEIKGIYVPFWLYDCKADARFKYKATNVRMWSDRNYNYTETSYFLVVREGNVGFSLVPADGSEKIPDELMESIEPYDYSAAVDFQTAYLSGFFAERYDVDAEAGSVRANERIRNSTKSMFDQSVRGYTSVIPETASIKLSKGRIRYALLPVWLLNTKYEGKMYTFAMNGQTGRFVGNLPVDKSAFRKWFLGIMAGSAAAVMLLLCLLL